MFRTIFTTLRALLKSGLCGPQLCIRSDTASYAGHKYKPFWTTKIWPGWQGVCGEVKIWPKIAPICPILHLIELKTCSTISGTHVQTILNYKDLTRSAVGVREGQNTVQYGANGGNFGPYFDLTTPQLRVLLRKTQVDSGFTQNFWVKSWREGALPVSTECPGQLIRRSGQSASQRVGDFLISVTMRDDERQRRW